MNILFIDKFYPPTGGPGSYTRCMTKHLLARGHNVMQFGTVAHDDPVYPRFHDFASSRNPLDIFRLIHNREAAARLDEFLKVNPVDIAHLHNIYHHLTPSIFPVLKKHEIGVVLRLADYRLSCPTKHFLRRDCEICTRCLGGNFVHAASPRCAGFGGVALALESYYHRFTKSYIKGVDRFICPTEFMREIMIKAGYPEEKMVVIRNAVEPMDNTAGVSRSDNELLFAGRLSPEKAPELMLDLAQRFPETPITIAGDGPMAEKLDRKIEERSLKNITMTGHLDHDKLSMLLFRAAALIITSRWLENSTMSMLEAMQAGGCVIVPDHGPLREWVTDRQTGRIYTHSQKESIFKVVDEILKDADGRKRMGENARKLVTDRHNPESISDALEKVYAQIRMN